MVPAGPAPLHYCGKHRQFYPADQVSLTADPGIPDGSPLNASSSLAMILPLAVISKYPSSTVLQRRLSYAYAGPVLTLLRQPHVHGGRILVMRLFLVAVIRWMGWV